MNINNFQDRMGDCILSEPAMAAWSILNDKRIRLYVEHPDYRTLYENHPHIDLVDEPHDVSDVDLDCHLAFGLAHQMRLPFAAGYFPMFGMVPEKDRHRLHYEINGITRQPPENFICICRHAYSCFSRKGQRPNIMVPRFWWEGFVSHFPETEILDVMDDGEALPGTTLFAGRKLREVAGVFSRAKAVVSVETGLLALAGGIPGLPIVFLSSATPIWFSRPRDSGVVRSDDPAHMPLDIAVRLTKRYA